MFHLVENQKDAIAVQSLLQYRPSGSKGNIIESISALLVVSQWCNNTSSNASIQILTLAHITLIALLFAVFNLFDTLKFFYYKLWCNIKFIIHC